VGINCCFSLVILDFLIWQFTFTRQIEIQIIISDKSKKISGVFLNFTS
jgi:hypothetical protein